MLVWWTFTTVFEPRLPLEERIHVKAFELYMTNRGLLVSRYDRNVFSKVFFWNLDVNAGAASENTVAQALTAHRRLIYFASDNPCMNFVTVADKGGGDCALSRSKLGPTGTAHP